MNRKGQAAMEFLMTYGWAILAAVIVVGVLWSIIGNPANLAGDRFLVSQPFVKSAMSISTSAVQVEVRNGAGETINITSVALTGCTSNATTITVTDGSLQAITLPCTLVSGERFSGDLTILYRTSGSSLDQSATGSVSGRVP